MPNERQVGAPVAEAAGRGHAEQRRQDVRAAIDVPPRRLAAHHFDGASFVA
jgi:hypothetical protein